MPTLVTGPERVVLVGVGRKGRAEEMESSLAELRRLVLHQIHKSDSSPWPYHVIRWYSILIENGLQGPRIQAVRLNHFLQIESLFLTDRLVISEQA